MELFGKLECSEDRPCIGLDKHAHFKDFGMAFLTLFRIATGDNWNGIMKVCSCIKELVFSSNYKNLLKRMLYVKMIHHMV